MPLEDRKVYDVRDVARALLDGGRMLEISPRWARNVVCAFGRLDGRSVGVVANQPRYLGGVLDVDASQKAARFVRTCNLFDIPLLVLVDTPGFLPGTKQEKLGVIRHGAKLVYAFAECTVPRVTVVLRKAFGGAYIAMNSKDLGADFVFAWPSAQLGVMGAPQAIEIINRREIEAAEDPEGASHGARGQLRGRAPAPRRGELRRPRRRGDRPERHARAGRRGVRRARVGVAAALAGREHAAVTPARGKAPARSPAC